MLQSLATTAFMFKVKVPFNDCFKILNSETSENK